MAICWMGIPVSEISARLLCFNIATVLKLEAAICSGILYNALMLYWDHCVRVGSRMKALHEAQQISERDIIHSMVVVDESHHILNAQYADCVRQLTIMAREMRKYFSGVVFATQLITGKIFLTWRHIGLLENRLRLVFQFWKVSFLACTQKQNCIGFLLWIWVRLSYRQATKI